MLIQIKIVRQIVYECQTDRYTDSWILLYILVTEKKENNTNVLTIYSKPYQIKSIFIEFQV